MSKKTTPQGPKLAALLQALGENIRLARMRRRITSTMLAERAGMTRATLSAIEKGTPTVSLGAYANALFSLGLEQDIALVARDDEFGRKLQDAGLLNKTKTKKRK